MTDDIRIDPTPRKARKKKGMAEDKPVVYPVIYVPPPNEPVYWEPDPNPPPQPVTAE